MVVWLVIASSPGTSCSFRNGGCSHHCNDTGESRVCSCDPGYNLISDQRTCRGEWMCSVGEGFAWVGCACAHGAWRKLCDIIVLANSDMYIMHWWSSRGGMEGGREEQKYYINITPLHCWCCIFRYWWVWCEWQQPWVSAHLCEHARFIQVWLQQGILISRRSEDLLSWYA